MADAAAINITVTPIGEEDVAELDEQEVSPLTER